MELAFYSSGLVAILATLGVITGTNPVHALLYLIVSLLSVAMVFFALGAPFAAALEIIVYAGAIMVLFVFVVMILNLGGDTVNQERIWLRPSIWIGPSLLAAVLMAVLIYSLVRGGSGQVIGEQTIEAREVAGLLFGPWMLLVELAAMLLLAALVSASHLGRQRDAQDDANELGAGGSQ